MSETAKSAEYEDLSGDPVYDHLLVNVHPGNKILGAQIIVRPVCAKNQARKIIRFLVEVGGTTKTKTYDFNYKKIERSLK